MFLHKKPAFFGNVVVGKLRQQLAVTPDPSTVVQFKNSDGVQERVNKKVEEVLPPKEDEKKKRRPGEKLLKKLTRVEKTETEKDKERLKRIRYSIKNAIKSNLIKSD
jgi:hypothetical protein